MTICVMYVSMDDWKVNLVNRLYIEFCYFWTDRTMFGIKKNQMMDPKPFLDFCCLLRRKFFALQVINKQKVMTDLPKRMNVHGICPFWKHSKLLISAIILLYMDCVSLSSFPMKYIETFYENKTTDSFMNAV